MTHEGISRLRKKQERHIHYRKQQIQLNLIKASQVKSSQVKSSQVKSSQVKSSQVKSNQIKSSQVKSSQVKSSQVKSSQVKSIFTFRSTPLLGPRDLYLYFLLTEYSYAG